MEILASRMIVHPSHPDESLAFYRDALGLAVYREFPGGTVFFLGGAYLEVSGQGDGAVGGDLALWLRVRDLDDTVARLAERGVTPVREPRLEPWGLLEAWIADPDGVRIVLVEVPPEHPMRRDPR